MIRQTSIAQAATLTPLFEIEDKPQMTMALSCLQGHIGTCLVGAEGKCALAIVGDFGFLAGDASTEDAKALANYIPVGLANPGFIYVPQNETWERLLLDTHGENARLIIRYAIQEQTHFLPETLKAYTETLPEGY